MVRDINRIYAKIPEIFFPLMTPHLEKVEEMISPGLSMLRWTSLNIGAFVDSVNVSLKNLELLIDRSKDILEVRIEAVLKDVQTTLLCDLPENDPWTMEEFISRTQVHTIQST